MEFIKDNLFSENDGKDLATLKNLYDKFFKAGILYTRPFLNNDELSADIVQEVFINIWKTRRIFSSENHFRSYYYKSLKNSVCNHFNRQKENKKLTNDYIDENLNTLESIIKEEVHRKVVLALEKLPTERRKIILLYMDGHSQEEIASLLKISVNTIKTQKRKAYIFLRKELQNLFTWYFILNSVV